MGNLRADANLRYRYQGPQRPGPGRPKTYDGKVPWTDLARFARRHTEDEHSVRYHQGVHPVQCRCSLHVVLVVDTAHHRRAVLLSTDVALDALTLSRYDKARCHLELLFRDAKPLTGWTDWQARSQAKLACHFHAPLSAVNLAKLEARQERGYAAPSFSMASLKRRAFNQHLIERMCAH